MFIIFHDSLSACDEVTSGRALIWKSLYSADINIALYDLSRKDDLSTVVCYFTLALHPSDQHYITIIKNILEN